MGSRRSRRRACRRHDGVTRDGVRAAPRERSKRGRARDEQHDAREADPGALNGDGNRAEGLGEGLGAQRAVLRPEGLRLHNGSARRVGRLRAAPRSTRAATALGVARQERLVERTHRAVGRTRCTRVGDGSVRQGYGGPAYHIPRRAEIAGHDKARRPFDLFTVSSGGWLGCRRSSPRVPVFCVRGARIFRATAGRRANQPRRERCTSHDGC